MGRWWARLGAAVPSLVLASACASIVGVGDITGADVAVDGSTGEGSHGDGSIGEGSDGDGSNSGSGSSSGGSSGSSGGSGSSTGSGSGSSGDGSVPSGDGSAPGGDACDGPCLVATASGTSCQVAGHGLTDCGGGNESCCASLRVPGGPFYRAYTNTGTGPSGQGAPATVSDFLLDKYVVTVGRFRRFVDAWNSGTGWRPVDGSGKHAHLNGGMGLANSGTSGTYETGWLSSDDGNVALSNGNLGCDSTYATWTGTAGPGDNLPMNCMNWWEAYAFCIWDGGFLPSETEWEYAAAGGSELREYPWGSAALDTSNQYAIYDCYYPSGSGTCSAASIAPVGSAPTGAGRWGQLDLVGEIWEWDLDWVASFQNPCTDCAYLTAATYRVHRGGYFKDIPAYLAVSNRQYPAPAPTRRGYDLGFRCARAP